MATCAALRINSPMTHALSIADLSHRAPAEMIPIRPRPARQKRHLGLRFAITAFVFVAIVAVVSLAAFAVKGALVRRGLDFKTMAQGIARYLQRSRSGGGQATTIAGGTDATSKNAGSLRKQEPVSSVRAVAPPPRTGLPTKKNAAVAHEEFCSLPPGSVGVADGARPLSSFDLVNAWPTERRAALAKKAPCAWALHRHTSIRLPAVPLCGASPGLEGAA